MKLQWFSAIGLFRHTTKDRNVVPQYEERVVLVRAKNEAMSEKLILREFKEYVKTDGIEFLNRYVIDELYDAPGRKVVEVAHHMRLSKLPPSQYISQFWLSLRPKSCDQNGWTHAWHNIDNKKSGCYNCQTVRKGQLWKRGNS